MGLVRMPVPVQKPRVSFAPGGLSNGKQASAQDPCKDAESEKHSVRRKRPRGASAFELDHENSPPGVAVSEENSHPKKTICIAPLKKHFAHTISKADQELFSAKAQQHEVSKQSVKAKTEAGAEVAPASGSALHKERQAARLALLKMQKVSEFNDNSEVSKELESLGYTQVGPLIVTHSEALKTQDNLQRPVEKLGLFLKNDDDLDDSEAKKALRIASLKRHFSHIIAKAERELLNSRRHQHEGKVKIEAVIKVAEDTPRKKPDSESQFQRERQAARLALQKVRKVWDFNDHFEVMKDLKSLGFTEVGVLIVKHQEALQSHYKLQRPVEKFGLFLQEENDVDEESYDSGLSTNNDDLEEGEIH